METHLLLTNSTHEDVVKSDKHKTPADGSYGSHELGYDGPSFRKHSSTVSNLSFHNIHYTVQVGTGLFKKEDKVILNDVSGVFRPGMNAIMGPTGGGKTSLLDILAGRKDKKGLSGTVLINGLPQPYDFRLISGYVVQDDVVMGTLTVQENLAFSAALRLPPIVSDEERKQRVLDVIEELALQDCANSQIGGEFIRGISGGERKRTNIGMELIIKPSILFMDEPTTGLDASTAGSVMSTMALLSKRGRTIIFSIHQPRFSIFRLFDKLHLLSKGETVYHGPNTELLEYFASLGYICEEHNNPADFFLDVVIENQAAVTSDKVGDPQFADDMLASDAAERGQRPRADTIGRHTSLAVYFKRSKYYQDMEHETRCIFESYERKEGAIAASVTYPTSFSTQFRYCSKRAFLNYLRNPKSSYGQVLMILFMALLVGMIFYQVDKSATSGIQDRVGAFFFIGLLVQSMNNGAVELFLDERVVFIHESATGFYRVSSYFVSKIFADLLPQRTLPTLLFAAITYYMIGLRPEPEHFFIYTLNLVLSTWTSCGIFFLIGASVSKFANAELFIAITFVLQMLFVGFLINIESLPVWLAWLEYLNLARYSYKILSINELKGTVFCYPYPNNATW
ncbi:broad substrate specificity ATP-binding cassette transporter ABCG2-like [Amphiura filiformis]|uniref:broad substrate specificity ATP-binding cassette transporter ABCG2-like n=1 Tax=Amphiura filiformis TaxID=82378 RepID=UPI003B22681A